jgi:hypothetical protein
MLISNMPIVDELVTIKLEVLELQKKILGDDALIRTKDVQIKINGSEITLPEVEYNPLEYTGQSYGLDRHKLLDNSLPFFKNRVKGGGITGLFAPGRRLRGGRCTDTFRGGAFTIDTRGLPPAHLQ